MKRMIEPFRPSSVEAFGQSKRSSPRQLLAQVKLKPSRSRKPRVWKKLVYRQSLRDKRGTLQEVLWYNWLYYQQKDTARMVSKSWDRSHPLS